VRFIIVFILAVAANATTIPQYSVEDLAGKSDRIIVGTVIRSSTSWGPEHKFIWTRYELAIEDTIKGATEKTLTVSSAGGHLDGKTMYIPGAVAFTAGERVALFLKTFASGDKLTVGWTQGKFDIDAGGRVHSAVGSNSGVVTLQHASVQRTSLKTTAIKTLDGLSLPEFRRRILAVAARTASTRTAVK
jgi:hypothetical protein